MTEHGMLWSEYLARAEPEDRALVAAVQLDKAEHCSMCGLTEREFAEDPDAYVAVQHVCPWCAVKDRERNAGDTDSSLPGGSLRLVPAATADRLRAVRPERPRSARERSREKL